MIVLDDAHERELAGRIVAVSDPARQALYDRLRQAIASTYGRDYELETMVDAWALDEVRTFRDSLAGPAKRKRWWRR